MFDVRKREEWVNSGVSPTHRASPQPDLNVFITSVHASVKFGIQPHGFSRVVESRILAGWWGVSILLSHTVHTCYIFLYW